MFSAPNLVARNSGATSDLFLAEPGGEPGLMDLRGEFGE